MPDAMVLAGLLLVVGPLVGAVPIANPALIPVWSAPRERHLAIVGAHRRAWTVLNGGFVLATVASATGLLVLAAALAAEPGREVGLAASAVTYVVGGVLWCAVLAIRSRTTPLLADLVAEGRPTEPAEAVLGAATGGLFAAFVTSTSLAIAVLGITLALGGGVAAPVAWIATLGAIAVLAGFLASGDTIPAILYLPTMLVGLALVLGWG